MSSESVRVTFFGKDYSLRADDGDIQAVRQAASYVNSKIAEFWELTASKDETKIAVLSALNIAGELLDIKAKYEAEVNKTTEYEDKVKSFSDMIGKARTVG